MANKIGNQTYALKENVSISDTYSIVGPMEGEGPLKDYFHKILTNDECNQKTFELAESYMTEKCYEHLFKNAGINKSNIDLVIGGDLLDQITATTWAVKDFDIPYWGVYNACATFSLSMQIAALGIESGAFERVVASASSHYSTSERQYRTPLEFGSQIPPVAQRTITGSGCVYIEKDGKGPYITHLTTGRIIDFKINDPFDMGTAMAPAAADTILAHFKDTNTSFKDYDMVITGDLGRLGLDIATDMLKLEGYEAFHGNFNDCGNMIFDQKNQIVNSGGSGAGCCAAVFCSHIFKLMKEQRLNKVLFAPTGALLSPTSHLQKQTIPAVCHAIVVSNTKE